MVQIIKDSQTLSSKTNVSKMIPKDIRTAMQRIDVSPKLTKSICCRTCYTIYPNGQCPSICTYKPTINSNQCNQSLFKESNNFRPLRDNGISQKKPSRIEAQDLVNADIPKCIYTTQSIISWLSWFLSKPYAENSLDMWAKTITTSSTDERYDVQQTLAWKSVQPSSEDNDPTSLLLVFNMYIDWFNPRGNTP